MIPIFLVQLPIFRHHNRLQYIDFIPPPSKNNYTNNTKLNLSETSFRQGCREVLYHFIRTVNEMHSAVVHKRCQKIKPGRSRCFRRRKNKAPLGGRRRRRWSRRELKTLVGLVTHSGLSLNLAPFCVNVHSLIEVMQITSPRQAQVICHCYAG